MINKPEEVHVLYKLLLGDQRQGGRYAGVFCDHLLTELKKGCMADFTDVPTTNARLCRYLDTMISSDLNAFYVSCVVGIQNYKETAEMDGVLKAFCVPANSGAGKMTFMLKKLPRKKVVEATLSYYDQALKLVQAYADIAAVPEDIHCDDIIMSAFYNATLTAKIQPKTQEEFEKLLRDYRQFAVKAAVDDIMLHSTAVEEAEHLISLLTLVIWEGLPRDITGTEEIEISNNAYVEDVLGEYPVATMKKLLFGEQKQGDLFTTSLAYHVCKYFLNGCGQDDDLNLCINKICDGIKDTIHTKRRDSPQYVLTDMLLEGSLESIMYKDNIENLEPYYVINEKGKVRFYLDEE